MARIALQPDPRSAKAPPRVAVDQARYSAADRARHPAADRAIGSLADRRATQRIALRELLEWVALAGAVLAGSSQLVGLLFGLFIFTSAA
jgi:hypothetical protein